MAASIIDSRVASVRSRLLGQSLVNRLALGLSVALAVALAWFLIQPLAFANPPANLRWIVLGVCVVAGLVVPIVWCVRTMPSKEQAALELDSRFALRERLSTAIMLEPELRETPAGKALLNDAESQAEPVRVSEKFPIRPKWNAAWIPALAICLALVAWLYHPSAFASTTEEDELALAQEKKAQELLKQQAIKKVNPFVKPAGAEAREAAEKSAKLKELENQLEKLGDKYAKDPYADTPEKAREKITELQPLEEKYAKYAAEQKRQLEQMRDKLEQLDKLNKDKDFNDGPAKALNDALSKGDLDKAKEEVDELRKKAKDKKLDKKDSEKLERQLGKMKDDLERLARDKEREEELEKKIDQAKKEGKDAESLERELERTKEENKESGEQLERLASKLGKAQEALSKDDLEKAAEELSGASEEIQNIQNKDEDLKEAEASLQRLKQERRAACKACEKGEGNPDGQAQNSKSGPNNGGIGAGEREINDKAPTAKGEEERQRGIFDITGKKNYGGLVKGQAFTKKAETELGDEIKQAVQSAPSAPDAQRLPRDARDSVKEYFEKLGNTGGK